MNKTEFLQLMRFPNEWLSSGMYVDDLFVWQLAGYAPGHEEGAEHNRNGAFHWWLRKNPDKRSLSRLLDLAAADPDPLLGLDVLLHLEKSPHYDNELALQASQLFAARRPADA
ncbi:hypothetical protein [Acidovorax sp. A1169]|uniref:hypothetical protein n=1 Tax=Acidovorax sp. A1169 TaxID=3059524 RepID=UPI002737E3EB|nr:hypothetical protein [Acidovorax sp. A1169]MDP4078346.1 hypothetical protein [Acidovorax sp. A1169]